MDDVLQYVVNNALIFIPVLNILGAILKAIQVIPNKFIPLILLVFGVGGALALLGFQWTSVVQGILVTGAAVYGHQMVKQMASKDSGEKQTASSTPAEGEKNSSSKE